MLLLLPLSSTQEAFRSRAQLCRSFAKNVLADVYICCSKLMVFGHTPVRKPDVQSNRINIDTALVFGGRLTAAVFEDSQAEAVDLLQVCFKNKSRIHILSASLCSFSRMPGRIPLERSSGACPRRKSAMQRSSTPICARTSLTPRGCAQTVSRRSLRIGSHDSSASSSKRRGRRSGVRPSWVPRTTRRP
jgi:hypothetical protein